MCVIILMGLGSTGINSLFFCRIAFSKEQLNCQNTVVSKSFECNQNIFKQVYALQNLTK